MAEPEADYEEVDALPVLAGPGEPAAAEPTPSRGLRARVGGDLAVQAAAVATAGFAAGAVTVAVAKRRRSRKPAVRRTRKDEPAGVVMTRRFLVDVHLLGGDGTRG